MLASAKIIGLIFFIISFIFDDSENLLSLQLLTNSNEHLLSLSVLPVGVVFYDDLLNNKGLILKDTKGRTEIYKWTHLESGKFYIGSAIDLSGRFKDYFSKSYISNRKTSRICNALVSHGYSAFSLTILEYIDNISNFSQDEARILILEREQHYLDSLEPEYNILKIAGSSLGYKHSEESLIKMSEVKIGRSLSAETKALISENMSDRTGENHSNFNKLYFTETKEKMSIAKTGDKNNFYGRTHSIETIVKMREAKLGISKSEDHKTKISLAKGGGTIFVYNSDHLLVNSFESARKAAEYFNVDKNTIVRYSNSGNLFKNEWLLSRISK